jgi:hypothetical protein
VHVQGYTKLEPADDVPAPELLDRLADHGVKIDPAVFAMGGALR